MNRYLSATRTQPPKNQESIFDLSLDPTALGRITLLRYVFGSTSMFRTSSEPTPAFRALRRRGDPLLAIAIQGSKKGTGQI